jgi:transcriptional regulator with XRE-family HTH domain
VTGRQAASYAIRARVAGRVATLMSEQHLTATSLAVRSELHVNTVLRVLNGKDVLLSTLERIATALGSSLDAIIRSHAA